MRQTMFTGRVTPRGQLTLPAMIRHMMEEAGATCLEMIEAGAGGAVFRPAPDDVLADAELAVMLDLLHADVLAHPRALTHVSASPAGRMTHDAVLNAPILGPSAL